MVMEEGGSPLSSKYWMFLYKFFKVNERMCIDSIKERPEIMKMIADKEKVDLVVTLSSCGGHLAYLLDAKVVVFSPAGLFNFLQMSTGNAVNLFVQPHLTNPVIEPMDFTTRMKNLALGYIWSTFHIWEASVSRAHLQAEFPGQVPESSDMFDQDRTVLFFSNSHVATHGSWPTFGNTVEIGGIHCKPGKELPSQLKDYMDSHPEGVVLVSFGSALSASQLSKEQQTTFQESFGELGIPIVWKWDGDLTNMPENIYVSKWLPQNDLLAHPNLKVFVTHGGLLSTQEALYHSVPLVGIPIANDQEGNMARAEKNGFAIRLDLKTINKGDLIKSIKRALTDTEMRKSVDKMHRLFVDNTLTGMTPLERGVAAINFIIENRGIEYLKPHKNILNMPFYQVHGYDIVIFIALVLVVVLTITLKCLKCCLRQVCFRKAQKHKEE